MSTNDEIVNAARAYRDAYAREHAPGAIPTGDARQLSIELLALCRELDASDKDAAADQGTSRTSSTPVSPRRHWPDPDGYADVCRMTFGDDGPPRDVPIAVAAWKALENGTRVMCARGHQWTADRSGGRLRFTMAKRDGRPGKTLEQPWYPLIVAKLPVWPIVIESTAAD